MGFYICYEIGTNSSTTYVGLINKRENDVEEIMCLQSIYERILTTRGLRLEKGWLMVCTRMCVLDLCRRNFTAVVPNSNI
jgi:hypothetical protein